MATMILAGRWLNKSMAAKQFHAEAPTIATRSTVKIAFSTVTGFQAHCSFICLNMSIAT
jgi:hypothetical protein